MAEFACLLGEKDVLEDKSDCQRPPDQGQRPCPYKRENLNPCQGKVESEATLLTLGSTTREGIGKENQRLSRIEYYEERFHPNRSK